MFQSDVPPFISVDDYLAGERDSPIRHEYVDGQVYAMAGASDRHNRIALRLAARLDAHVGDEGPCQVFIADMKVRVAPNVFYYPDVVVACDPPGGDPYLREAPRLIIEVMSPSTERTDRQEKRLAYGQVPSVMEYVLVAQDLAGLEVFRRRADGTWARDSVLTRLDDVLELRSVGLTLTLKDVYRGTQ